MSDSKLPEPWLRGALSDVPAVPRAVLHALELAREDIQHWCGSLTDAEFNVRPAGIAPVAFHVRHIVRSADRLLTYAEGHSLSSAQIAALRGELDAPATRRDVFAEFDATIEEVSARVRALAKVSLEAPRNVGKKQLPTTVGGLLVHVADHTQRHVGQAITTAKVVVALRHPTE